MALVRLRNNTGVAQNIVHEGRQIIMGPHEENDFVKAVADKFLEIRAPLVGIVEDEIGGVYEEQAPDIVWVANMTGNPDAPDQVKAKLFVNRHWQMTDTDNPNKAPRPLVLRCDMGMREYIAKDGATEALNLGKQEIRIPPYKRRPMPSSKARWWLNRDATGEPHFRGASIKSRAPTAFEPSPENIDDWSLDDLRAYLKLMDPVADLGRSEEQVTKDAKKRNHRKAEEIKAHVEEEKALTMKRLFFRLVNPVYPIPTRAEFNEYLRGAPETQGTVTNEDIINDAEKQLKKARTRRRKKAEPEVQPEA
jgi:hypothetical protein